MHWPAVPAESQPARTTCPPRAGQRSRACRRECRGCGTCETRIRRRQSGSELAHHQVECKCPRTDPVAVLAQRGKSLALIEVDGARILLEYIEPHAPDAARARVSEDGI